MVIDSQALENRAAPREAAEAAAAAATAARAAARDEDAPKLCPDPEPDVPQGDSDLAKAYQAQISRLNNPQAPLPPGVAVSLINPETGDPVTYDDCRESDRTMIEAKGPRYAKLLENEIVGRNVRADWIRQATDQV